MNIKEGNYKAKIISIVLSEVSKYRIEKEFDESELFDITINKEEIKDNSFSFYDCDDDTYNGLIFLDIWIVILFIFILNISYYIIITNMDRIINKNDPKYILGLKFLNIILQNNNKPQINDILDFKNITRQEILKEDNLNKLNEMENELYKYFDKIKCGYYRKTTNYVITFFQQMLKELGYKAIRNERDFTVNIDGVNYRKKFMIYHIE
jgi:hypothetical protein